LGCSGSNPAEAGPPVLTSGVHSAWDGQGTSIHILLENILRENYGFKLEMAASEGVVATLAKRVAALEGENAGLRMEVH
jgi:hypothetical protein